MKIKPNIIPATHLQLAENMITEAEALTLKPYHCSSGKLTIGYGRNIEDTGISYAEAELMMANDIISAHDRLDRELAFYRNLSDARKAVLIDMYHNLGLAGLMGFKMMLTALRNENYDEAASQIQNSRYWSQVGSRAMRNYCMVKFNRYFTKAEAHQFFKISQP